MPLNPTGQSIVNSALTILNVLELGATPSASDSNAALAELNSMWDAWGIDEGLVNALVPTGPTALTGGVASYTVGTGATISVARPSIIYEAYISGTNRNGLRIVDAKQYFSHNDLTASAVTPDELYPDFAITSSGYITVYLWPIPSGTPSLSMIVGTPFSAWTLAAAYQLPYGYQDAIQYALAWRLIPQFGSAVDPKVAAVVSELGQKAEARLRAMNTRNRQADPATMGLAPPPQARP